MFAAGYLKLRGAARLLKPNPELQLEQPQQPGDGYPAAAFEQRGAYETFTPWCLDATMSGPVVYRQPVSTEVEALALINWAHAHGYRVRPIGIKHNWSPLTLSGGGGKKGAAGDALRPRVVLADMATAFNSMWPVRDGSREVTFQPGVRLASLLKVLAEHGLALPHTPAINDVTMGGVLTINGHGTAISSPFEPHDNFGTLSHRLVEIRAAVYDAATGRFEFRDFRRDAPHGSDEQRKFSALQTSLGRTFVTRFTLQCEPNYYLRCQSFMNIPAAAMFAEPVESVDDAIAEAEYRMVAGTSAHATAARAAVAAPGSMAACVLASGRAEAIWFPSTTTPWLKVWSVCPQEGPAATDPALQALLLRATGQAFDTPSESRRITEPCPFWFADALPKAVTLIFDGIMGVPVPAPMRQFYNEFMLPNEPCELPVRFIDAPLPERVPRALPEVCTLDDLTLDNLSPLLRDSMEDITAAGYETPCASPTGTVAWKGLNDSASPLDSPMRHPLTRMHSLADLTEASSPTGISCCSPNLRADKSSGDLFPRVARVPSSASLSGKRSRKSAISWLDDDTSPATAPLTRRASTSAISEWPEITFSVPAPESCNTEPAAPELFKSPPAIAPGAGAVVEPVAPGWAIARPLWRFMASGARCGPHMTPCVGRMWEQLTEAAMRTPIRDVWGAAKNSLVYCRSSTLRVTANGYAVLMHRRNLQRGIHEFTRIYSELTASFATRGLFPANGPLEIRVTGVDRAAGLHAHNAGYDRSGAVVDAHMTEAAAGPFASPSVSALHVDADCTHYGYDIALWLDVLSLPGTPGANDFYTEMEAALLASPVFSNPKLAKVRPEWSKGWGYTAEKGAWSSEPFLQHAHAMLPQWSEAVAAWNDMDPTRVFGNAALDRITS